MAAVIRHGRRTDEDDAEREQRLRLIESAARDTGWDWNLVTGELTWTDAIESVFGYAPEEVDSSIQWWLDRVHPDSRDRVAADLFRLMKRGGSRWTDEYRFRRRDGTYAVVFDRGTVVRDDDGNAVRMVGSMVDHSDFARLDARLLESRSLMHSALEALTPHIAILDRDGTILATNEAWRRFARENGGDSVRTGAGMNYVDVCRSARGPFSDGAQAVAAGLERLLSGDTAQYELEYPCPEPGMKRWFMLRATPLADGRGAVTAHIDITALKSVESRIRCIEQAGHVVASSLDAQQLLVNLARFSVPRLSSLCIADLLDGDELRRVALVRADGANRADADGVDSPMLVGDPAASPPAVVRALRSGECERADKLAELFPPSGPGSMDRVRGLEAAGITSGLVVPLRVSGRVLGALSFGWTAAAGPSGPEDVHVLEKLSERAAMAVDNAEHYEEKQRAIRARDDVLAVVSHDLRNLLNQALLGTGLLLKGPGNAPTRRAAEIVGRATERMRRLVADLLDFANVEAGRLALDRRPARVSALVREAQALLEPLAERNEMKLAFEVVGDADVQCDQGRVLQVLSNLVGNAVKFSPPRADIQVRVDVGPRETRFSVVDRGPGIDPADMPHIFERYWRGKQAPGCGLGLAIAKGIVEGHGGMIWVDSDPGKGSAFRFTLPHAAAAR